MFLRNCWYVAAWSRDVGRKPLSRTILKEKIVMFRQKDGTAVALEDSCPHRKLPLSMGRLQGDAIECGYHGLQFDGTGACILAPTQGAIPPKAKVKSYPLAEKWGFVWIWMGDTDKLDESLILDIANFDNSGWGKTEGGTLEIDCHYLWITDNLLDPSHVAWVHTTSFAAPGTDDTPLQTQLFDDGVVVSRWISDQPLPPYYAPVVAFEGNCDRMQHYEVRMPSICINKSIFTPRGTGGSIENLDASAFFMTSYNFMTPVDEDRTTYYWFQHYNAYAQDESMAERLNEGAVFAFNEDRVVLEAVHKGMKNKQSAHLNLGLDAGSMRFRKMLDDAVLSEQES